MDPITDIKSLEVPQLQALVTKYPWFSYAREVLLYRLVEIEPQCLESRYKEQLAFFPRRENLLMGCRALIAAKSAARSSEEIVQVPVATLLEVEEEVPDIEMDFDFTPPASGLEEFHADLIVEEPAVAAGEQVLQESVVEIQPQKPRVVVVGGDYFSKEDFAQLEESQEASQIKFGAPAQDTESDPVQPETDWMDFDTLDFETETLAKIYADQGYYDKAIEVYAKLILLYPEKSTYFATLVNEIKSKN